MGALRQRFQSAFRVTAAVVMLLWIASRVACSLHCAGMLGGGDPVTPECCHRVAAQVAANSGNSTSQPTSDSSEPGCCGCLKEFTAGKPVELTPPGSAMVPQGVWLRSILDELPVAAVARDTCADHHRQLTLPAIFLGRALRSLAPPFLLA